VQRHDAAFLEIHTWASIIRSPVINADQPIIHLPWASVPDNVAREDQST
jgi:hypothetical protein